MPSVLVTGCNRGLGLEFAKQYLEEGWTVYGCARSASPALDELAHAHPALLQVYALDVLDHHQIDELARELSPAPIDVLLLSAGTMGKVDFAQHGLSVGGFGDSDYEDWLTVFQVNTIAVMKMAETFLDNVLAGEQRKIVALSSMVGSMGLNNAGGIYGYRASKAGLNAVMRSMGIDLKEKGIIALPVHPGWARTDLGGPKAPVDPIDGVAGLRKVIAGLTMDDCGRFLAYDGSELPW